MAEGTEDDTTYLDEVVDETPMLFASSDAVLTIEDPNLHPMGKATAVFLLFTCLMGFLNGLDYASPNDGLVRPDEFVYRLALTAPDDTATFRGTVVDETGQPHENATVYLSWLDDATGLGVSGAGAEATCAETGTAATLGVLALAAGSVIVSEAAGVSTGG